MDIVILVTLIAAAFVIVRQSGRIKQLEKVRDGLYDMVVTMKIQEYVNEKQTIVKPEEK